MTPEAASIAEQYSIITARVAAACRRAGRSPEEVTIVGVTKTKPAATVRAAAEAGIVDVGENYVQELVAKHDELGGIVRWHFIGSLQRNKVRSIIPFVHIIHAVDSERLGVEIDRQAQAVGRRVPVLLQVNTSDEESKHGVRPEEAADLARRLGSLPGIELRGLMTLAAFLDDPEAVRPMFALLRTTRDRLERELGLHLPELSMGMTNDFEVAVEEGSTMVRIGTAIFGARSRAGSA
jgi:pyridoxal phosphate enzyme (YggS family)